MGSIHTPVSGRMGTKAKDHCQEPVDSCRVYSRMLMSPRVILPRLKKLTCETKSRLDSRMAVLYHAGHSPGLLVLEPLATAGPVPYFSQCHLRGKLYNDKCAFLPAYLSNGLNPACHS